MNFVAKTDIGKKRNNNEDAFFAKIYNEDTAFFIVADGLGGYESGEVASNILITTMSLQFEENFVSITEKVADEKVPKILNHMLQSANEKIYQLEKTDAKYRGMGTTIVLLAKINHQFYQLAIGDSRLYYVDEKMLNIEQITVDDTYVNELLKTHAITKEEIENHPQKHVLTKAVGIFKKVDGKVGLIKKTNGYFVLCTDGLTNMLNNVEILNIMKKYHFEELALKLVFKANLHGGTDNITVVVVKI